MKKIKHFHFDEVEAIDDQDFILRIPKGIETPSELLSYFSREGNFPGYFGENWDALLDCLRDFHWIKQRRILILHEDLPLSASLRDLQIYLDILETAIIDWHEDRSGPYAEWPESMPYVPHELVVIFPERFKNQIAQVMNLSLN